MVLEQFIIDADIIWDQVGKTFFENPEAKAGRIMRVQVINAGVVEDLTGYTLNLGWTSVRDPSKFGLDAFDDVDITKGIFEIEYTSGMLTNIGPLNASLQLVPPGEGRPIESNNFKLTVKNSAINAAAIQGETSFSTLENALVEVNSWNARIDEVEQEFKDRADALDEAYPVRLTAAEQSVAAVEAQVDLLNRGLGETMPTMASLLSTYPTGDTRDHIVAGNIAEVDTLTVTGIPTTAGNVTVTLNGVAVNVPVTIGVAEVASLVVSAVPTVAGNVTVNLNGTAVTVAVDPAVETTTDLVAAKIRATVFTGWTIGGTGSTVTFTATAVGTKTDATYSAGTTGATGTMTTTTQGVAAATTTTVATAIRAAVFAGWTTGGTGAVVTFTATTAGTRTAPVFSGGATGTTGTFVRTAIGEAANFHRYFWNGSAWTDGGAYQAIENTNDSIKNEHLKNASVSADKTDFLIGNRQFIKSESVIMGSYWTYSGGITSAVLGEMSRYPKIRAKAGQAYTLNWCRPYFSFIIYDDGTWARLSATDSPLIVRNVSVTPTKDGYIYLSVTNNTVGYPISEWMMVDDTTVPITYLPYGYYNVSLPGLHITLDDVAPGGIDIVDTNYLTTGKNKLNVAISQDGVWVDTYGVRRADASIFTVEQKIEPNQDFVLQGTDPSQAEIWYSIYNNSGGLISGGLINYNAGVKTIGFNEHFVTPSNAATIAISARLKSKYLLQLEEGTVATTYEPYSLKIAGKELFGELAVTTEYVEYHLYADGSGDFANLRLALVAITDASPTKRYIIYIHEGDYDVTTWYTVAEINALTSGPTLKDYVDLVGVGNKEKIRLIARLSTGIYSADSAMAFAPLNLKSICEVSNLTVIGQNTRYAIHDDANTPGLPARHKYTDVIAIKESGLGLSNAYGAGSGNGAHYEYDNCQFISFSGTPFRLHNTHDQTIKAIYKFNNVKAINKSSSGYGMQFESEGSLTEDEIILIGVDSPAGIVVILDNYARTVLGWNPDGINDFRSITGHGNTLSPNLISTLDGHDYYFDLNGEVIKGTASSAITKGDAVKRTSNRAFAKMGVGDDISLFAGIALTTVAANEIVPVQTRGYYPVDRTTLSVVVGNKIGIASGALSVVATGDYIGVVEVSGFIKLK